MKRWYRRWMTLLWSAFLISAREPLIANCNLRVHQNGNIQIEYDVTKNGIMFALYTGALYLPQEQSEVQVIRDQSLPAAGALRQRQT